MSLYALVLFLHLLAALVLFFAMGMEMVSLSRLRRAANMAELRTWISPLPSLPALAIGSLFLLLLSGIYLAIELQAGALAWPKVALVAMFLIAPLGAVSGRRIRLIREIAERGEGADYIEIRQRAEDPLLGLSLAIRLAVVLGIVMIMAAKPSLNASLLIVGAWALLGWLASLPLRRKPATSPIQRN